MIAPGEASAGCRRDWRVGWNWTGNCRGRCPGARCHRARCPLAGGFGRAAAEVREAGWRAIHARAGSGGGDAPTHLDDFLSANGLICDVLVNSAGYGLRGAATALPVDDQLGIIDLNIRALSELSLHFLPGMVARGRGGVLNLSSVAGSMPGPYMALYYASKGFVRSFSEALHQELRRTGVTVTCVAPGPVTTSFYERAGARSTALFSVLPMLDSGGCGRTRVARVQIRPPSGSARLFGQVGGSRCDVPAFRADAAADRPAAT